MKYNNASVITKTFSALTSGFNSWEIYRNLSTHLKNNYCSLAILWGNERDQSCKREASCLEFVTCILIYEPHIIYNHAKNIIIAYTLITNVSVEQLQ